MLEILSKCIVHIFHDQRLDRGGPFIFYQCLAGQRVSENTFSAVSGYLIDWSGERILARNLLIYSADKSPSIRTWAANDRSLVSFSSLLSF